LRNDLVFYAAIVAAASILFMVLPLLTGPYQEEGLDRIGAVVSGTLITLIQGLITGAVALLAISLVEHFFLLFVDVHREFELTMKIGDLRPVALYSLFLGGPPEDPVCRPAAPLLFLPDNLFRRTGVPRTVKGSGRLHLSCDRRGARDLFP